MKLQKILISIIMIIATLLIGAGILYSLPGQEQEKEKIYKEDRDYKLVNNQAQNTIADPALTKEDFGKTTQSIGFEEIICHKTLCIAKHDTYKEKDYKDIIQVEQDPEGNKMFTISLYFHNNDYNQANISKQLNILVPNFAGTKITEEQLKELEDIYVKGKIEEASKTYIVGPYTMELLIKKINEKFHLVRFKYVSTSLYD